MKAFLVVLGLTSTLHAASWKTDLDEARRLQQSGETSRAEAAYGQILQQADELAPLDLNELGLQLFYSARYTDAEAVYRRALRAWDAAGPAAALNRITTEGNLGALLRAEARYAESEALLLDDLHQAEVLAGKNSLEYGRASSGLGALYLSWGQVAKAEKFALQAQTILAGQLEEGHTERVNNSSILASVYAEERRYAEAEPLLQAVLAHADDHLLARTYNDLAVLALRQNELSKAEALALKARESVAAGLPFAAVILTNMGQICRLEGRYIDAEKHYREAIEIWEHSLGRNHPDTAKAYMNLAAFYHLRGREHGAEDLYQRAAAVFESVYGASHALTLIARNQLADVYRAEGRYTESEKLGQVTLAALEQSLGPEDPRVLQALVNEAHLYANTKRTKEAAAIRNRVTAVSNSLR
ncbi:MAG: tetratricopeptide repeat protein [Acidobacteriia bacterium]|nr:tetratricopeptide repeat protein [Terriglobia bacterium]